MIKKNYDELVTQAEAAVAKVKDAELRRVAFEKILDDLLQLGAKHSDEEKEARSLPLAPKAKKKVTRAGSRRNGPIDYIKELSDEGFFKKQKTISEVKAELVNRGHHIPVTSLSSPLITLCKKRILRRQKTKGDGKKRETFGYSTW
jgi:hypothetical protein